MNHIKCSQCAKQFSKRSLKIFENGCGHFKCRSCLSKDVSDCTTCNKSTTQTLECDTAGNGIHPTKTICKSPHTIHEKFIDKHIQNAIDERLDVNKIPIVKLFAIDGDKKTGRKSNTIKNSKVKKQLSIPSHIKSSEFQDGVQYSCTICGSRFKHEKQLFYHSYCATVRPHACKECPKRFVRKAELNHHLNVHAGVRKFICNTCNASFFEKSKLVVHTRIHTGLKSHKCNKCESKFYTSSALKEHALIHLETKQFTCKICHAQLSNVSNLRKHEERHKNLVYECPICKKNCHTKAYLRVHSKSCNKTFKCQQCSKVFHSKKDKDRHAYTHTDVKKFQCKYCNIAFNRKDNVRRHIKNAHAEVDLSITKSFSILVDRNEMNVRLKSKPENVTLPKIDKKITKESKAAVEEKTINSVPLKLNAASYSLDDLYKKIFIYKDHETFIPVTHCPDGTVTNASKEKIVDSDNNNKSNMDQNKVIVINDDSCEVISSDDNTNETPINSNSRETRSVPITSEVVSNPMIHETRLNPAICEEQTNRTICEALPTINKGHTISTNCEIFPNDDICEALPNSVVNKTCVKSTIGEILLNPVVAVTNSNPIIYQMSPNRVVYGVQPNTTLCQSLPNLVIISQTLPSNTKTPKNSIICETSQNLTNGVTLSPMQSNYTIHQTLTSSVNETLSTPLVYETYPNPVVSVSLSGVCDTFTNSVIHETQSNLGVDETQPVNNETTNPGTPANSAIQHQDLSPVVCRIISSQMNNNSQINCGVEATDIQAKELQKIANCSENVPTYNLNNKQNNNDNLAIVNDRILNSPLSSGNKLNNDVTYVSLKSDDVNKSGTVSDHDSSYYLNYDSNVSNYKLDETSQRNLNVFTQKDIKEANQQRQSVIFLSQTVKKTETKQLSNSNSLLPSTNSPQAIIATNKSIVNQNEDNPPIIVVPNDSDCNKYLSQVDNIEVIVIPDESDSRDDNTQVTFDLTETTSKESNVEIPLTNTTNNTSTRVSNEENDYSKPMYIHKKVNYDQTPVHQLKKYSNKTNNSEVQKQVEKKQLSKEELSELYKKILLPGYKGIKNNMCMQMDTESPSQQKESSSKKDISSTFKNNKNSIRGAKSPPSNPQHWRRRLAHNSKNS